MRLVLGCDSRFCCYDFAAIMDMQLVGARADLQELNPKTRAIGGVKAALRNRNQRDHGLIRDGKRQPAVFKCDRERDLIW